MAAELRADCRGNEISETGADAAEKWLENGQASADDGEFHFDCHPDNCNDELPAGVGWLGRRCKGCIAVGCRLRRCWAVLVGDR